MLTVGKHSLKHWEKSRKEAGLREVHKAVRGRSALCPAKPGSNGEQWRKLMAWIYQVAFLFSSWITETEGEKTVL